MKRLHVVPVLLLLVIGQLVGLVPTAGAAANPILGLGTVYGGMSSDAGTFGVTDDLEDMAAWAGRRVTFGGTFHNVLESEPDCGFSWAPDGCWALNTATLLEQVWQAEATPVANLGIDASAASIASGAWDDEIVDWANRVKTWTQTTGGPQRRLFIAPLQEHNGIWTPYGCDPDNFRAAYARIRNLVRGVGLDETRVRWVWAPNGWNDDRGACAGTTLQDYYPGAAIVDLIGFSAYRWSDGANVQGVTGYVADELRTFAGEKPYLVIQTAAWPSSTENQWIRDLFTWVENDPNTIGLIWFNFNKSGQTNETDWRVWNSATGQGINVGWKDAMSASGTDYQFPLDDWFQSGALNFVPYPDLCDRLAGASRFATSAAISADTFNAGVPIAYLATGYGFADALAAAAAAGYLGGPVLLVSGDLVSNEVMSELQRLNPDRIVVVGGTSVVGNAVIDAVDWIAPTDRIGGANRYDTAALLATDAFNAGVPVAYIATGLNYPDALAAAAAAGAQGGPVLLTDTNSVPGPTIGALQALQPDKIIVVGGTSAVSTNVENTLRGIQPNLVRIAGSNRYDTAAQLAAFNNSPDTVFLATGLGFADALAGASAAGHLGVPLLLSDTNSLPTATAAKLTAFNPNPARCVVLGGTAVVTDYVSWQAREATG